MPTTTGEPGFKNHDREANAMTENLAVDLDKMEAQCEMVSNVLKTLAHPKRLLLLCHLTQGERNVSELTELTGLSQSQVSQFLKSMTLQGLVKSRSQGSNKYFFIIDDKLQQLISTLHQVYCEV
ncbi:ArsR/SmtB family transcription factor [Paraferrimonas sedimenticola]|uniref:Transcriptional regulator n=1 Tax=Paraferrimonas sedimenticola TaxID=375674 RepID=A0AA37RX97_9GAMM|nr:metalloregulator ArsR/SmtB family transcription factor [Paraferrimonas sedimenticola]GLP97054.1 transcriptional regulator [Paraferrimonas sedimenticola]